MLSKPKYIFDFLPENDRNTLQSNLEKLKNVENTNYISVNSKDVFLEKINNLSVNEPAVIQIIAHGNCDGFGLSKDEFVQYTELINTLSNINSAAQNKLVLNLMTVCCSIYQLPLFNSPSNSLYEMIIGSTKGAFVNGSVLHSKDINQTDILQITSKIAEINYNINDEFSEDKKETWTYMTA